MCPHWYFTKHFLELSFHFFSKSKGRILHELHGLESLIQTLRVFSEDIGMKFGIEKCVMLVIVLVRC